MSRYNGHCSLFMVCFGVVAVLSLKCYADQVDDLIAQLKDPDMVVQCQVIEKLGQIKDKRAVEPLILLISGPSQPAPVKKAPAAGADPAVQKIEQAKQAVAGGDKHAAAGLSADPAMLKKLNAELRAAQMPNEIKNIISQLAATKDKRAVDPLLTLLNTHNSFVVQSEAASALGDLGDPKATPALLQLLTGQDSSVQSKQPRDARSPSVKQVSVPVRKEIAKALGKIGDPAAAEPLYNTLVNDSFLKTECAQALAQMGGYHAVKFLNQAAISSDSSVKAEAQKALDGLGPRHGLEPLTQLLADSDPKVRSLAATALTELNDSTIQEELKAGLGKLDENTRQRIEQKQSQNRIEQVTSIYDAAFENTVKIAAIEALGQISDPKAVRALLAALHDSDNAVARAAGKALAGYKSKAVITPIEMTLKTNDIGVTRQAIADLGLIGSDYAVEIIARYLNNAFVKDQAIQALGDSNNPKALSLLETAMQSPLTEDKAVEAILKIDHPDRLKLLIKGLSSKNFVMRQKIVDALKQYNDPSIVEPLIAVFKTNDPAIHETVTDILNRYPDPRIDAAFAEFLTDAFQKDKMLTLLKARNWQPKTTREKVFYYIAAEDWDKCVSLGPEATELLLEEFKKTGSVGIAKALNKINDPRAWPVMLEYVKKWACSPEILAGAEKTGWKPATLEEKIQAAVCKDPAEFMQLWKDPKVKDYFINALNVDNNMAVTIVSLSIRYKLTEMVNPMISRLNSINDDHAGEAICNQFLGSYNKTLYDAGKQWAESKGGRVIEFKIPGVGGW